MIDAFKQICDESFSVSVDHGVDERGPLTKYVDELLIRQEEESWELASLPLQQMSEPVTDTLAILVAPHEYAQEVFSVVNSVHLGSRFEAACGKVVQLLDLHEELSL